MKFGIFTDLHYSDKEIACRTRRPSASLDKLRVALGKMQEADALICLGDLVDDCGNAEKNKACLEQIMELIRSTGKPFYCIPGNHDCQNFEKPEFYEYTGCQKLPLVLKAGSHRLCFIDACFSADGNAYGPGRVDWKDTDITQEQLEWLKNRLANEEKGAPVVFLHQCLDPNIRPDHLLHSAEIIRGVLEDSGCVDTVISGHYHPGADNIVNGIRYLTLPAMCELDNIPFTVMEF